MNRPSIPFSYHNLEEIRQRKQELRQQLDKDSAQIANIWGQIFVKREESTRGQFISNIISNSALAIDAFLMFRKLRKNYKGIASLFRQTKKRH